MLFELFQPINASTTSLSVTATNTQGTLGANGSSLLLTNLGPNKCYVRIGTAAATAVTTDMPVLPNTAMIIARPEALLYIAAICDTSETATLKATLGYGV